MLPATGLNGDYRGACIACLQPTDTALAFKGDAEWLIAGLKFLSLPYNEAYEVYRLDQLEKGHDLHPGDVRDGTDSLIARVCAACVAKSRASFPAPALALPGQPVPVISQHA